MSGEYSNLLNGNGESKMSFNTNEEAVNILYSEILKARKDNPLYTASIEQCLYAGKVIDESKDLEDEEMIQYCGAIRSIEDAQRQMNASMTGLIDNISKTKDFNEWFDIYSFKYIPSFAKPLIKQWVKAAYFAALGEVK
ncbi:MAG: hypothetical protein GY886_01295 [Gammaproteobacteria bacterium]|nr:hypothetical protein [Gammaproteobacteria bacterium]